MVGNYLNADSPDTIDEIGQAAEEGLNRIGTDAELCFAFLRHCGLLL